MCPSTRPRNADTSPECLIDAHCHIDFPVFEQGRDQLLADCAALGVRKIVVPGTVPEGWERILALARHQPMLAPAAGLHPWWADGFDDASLAQLERLLNGHCELVAVGECGLDRKRGPPLAQQQAVFEGQIRLAEAHARPLLIHSVAAHDEVISLLRRGAFSHPFLMHGFSGSMEQAEALVKRGAFIGVSGIITHARSRKTRAVIAQLPLEALVLETDAPGLPPEGVPKGGNSPLNLIGVLDSLCALREESRASVVDALWGNTQRLFMQRLAFEGLHERGAPV